MNFPGNILDYLLPAGWGGMAVMALWQFFTTKKERKLAQHKDSTAITAADIQNAKTLIEMWKEMNAELENKVEKQSNRIGFLEGRIREMSMEYEHNIREIQEEHRNALQKIESFYREKCRDCDQQVANS